jgi:uroporphyrinogen decarboxylase
MSYKRALDAIWLRDHDGIAQQENLDHPAFMQEVVGYNPWDDPQHAYIDAYRALDTDWVFGIPKRAIHFRRGESSREGEDGIRYTEWGLSGSGWRETYPVHDVEDVLNYEPLQLRDQSAVERVIESRKQDQALMGDSALVSGLYYTTLFQFPIMTFGWELFLIAAASEPRRFQRVLRDFAEVTRFNLAIWAKAGFDVMFLHDDIAIERGLVFHPHWYREYLFPLYEYLLEPIKSMGQTKIAFVSDGDYTPMIPDLVSLGYDGFIVNNNMHLGELSRTIGADHFLIGNVDTSILTFGTPDDVRREVKRCIEQGKGCAGHIMKATADLPHNIPLPNIRAYFEATGRLK